jgi:hypothetical protein
MKIPYGKWWYKFLKLIFQEEKIHHDKWIADGYGYLHDTMKETDKVNIQRAVMLQGQRTYDRDDEEYASKVGHVDPLTSTPGSINMRAETERQRMRIRLKTFDKEEWDDDDEPYVWRDSEGNLRISKHLPTSGNAERDILFLKQVKEDWEEDDKDSENI